MAEVEDSLLPALREDLQLQAGPVAADGAPSWTIYDPARGRYFRISWESFQMLSNWPMATLMALVEKINAHTTCKVTVEDVRELIRFLFINNLTTEPAGKDFTAYYQQYQAGQPAWYIRLLHGYLFFRIPLLRPNHFLKLTAVYLDWCFNPKILTVLFPLAILALYLVSRQWEVFLGSFLHFFSWEGLMFYGLAIAFSKTLHELGHAYTAIRYGCKVPTLGLAFMALLPMPYTDVTDAWRLSSRRQRVAIGGAGIAVELALAVLATLAWSFMPDGSLRSACFILATTTWLMTLTINCSPFMRFDGYYMLADAWGVDNLQHRAFALGRWQLRQWLFGGNLLKPEFLPADTEYKLLIYAYITWLYRLLLFFGIAVMVYHFFFKILGILMFIVEMVFFIINPIVQELQVWRKLKTDNLSPTRQKIFMLLLMIGLGIVIYPWHTSVRIPALIEPERHSILYAAEPAQIRQILVQSGDKVVAGQLLFKLAAPKLDDQIQLSEKRISLYQLQLERSASNRETVADMHTAMQRLATESTALSGLLKQRERLFIRAPFAGQILDVYPDLRTGYWINTATPLARVVDPDISLVRGIADEDSAAALENGQHGIFVPDEAYREAIPVKLAEIAQINIKELDQPYLASVFGGSIAVKQEAGGKLSPTASVFTVRLHPEQPVSIQQKKRGVVVVDAQPRSFIRRMFDSSLALLIRESGF